MTEFKEALETYADELRKCTCLSEKVIANRVKAMRELYKICNKQRRKIFNDFLYRQRTSFLAIRARLDVKIDRLK